MSYNDNYTRHWDDKFRCRPWGRYPAEDLVRFMARNFNEASRNEVRVLEVGCGPGANIWFLHREGFATAGIDDSPAAIELARERVTNDSKGRAAPEPDLRVGNFAYLPWQGEQFDAVIDIFALYSNTSAVISRATEEIARVLKPDGAFYSHLWGTNTSGYGQGNEIEPGTFDSIPAGPCRDMGVSHFFTRDEIGRVFGTLFTTVAIEIVSRTKADGQFLEEFHCHFRKAR